MNLLFALMLNVISALAAKSLDFVPSECQGEIIVPNINTSAVIMHVNMYRSIHRVGDITASPNNSVMTLACSSWVKHMAKYNYWQHSKYPYGENLAAFSVGASNLSDATYAMQRAVDIWYSESKKYTYGAESFSYESGHFTQLVWRASKIGTLCCAYCSTKRIMYMAMMFDPPGNYYGAFAANVLTPRSTLLTKQVQYPPLSPIRRIRPPPPPPPPPFNPPPPTYTY